jgi:NADPH:quinone reductase-like Zn-dependent oxidoreductase
VFRKRGNTTEFRVLSRPDQNAKTWQEHAGGTIAWAEGQSAKRHDLAALQASCSELERRVEPGALVPESEFLVFGPRWQSVWRSIEKVKFGPRHQLTAMALGAEFEDDLESYRLHPALLDVALFVYGREPGGGGSPHLPFSYGVLTVRGPLPRRLYSYIEHLGESRFHVMLLDEQGNEVVRIEDYELRAVDAAKMAEEAAAARKGSGALRIEIGTPGMLETLRFHPTERRSPLPHEVEIEVKAVGLNFKDVLFALGVLPTPQGQKPKLGMECAGVLTAVGSDVRGLAVGDEVFAMALHSFATHVTTPALAVGKKPAHLGWAEAAGIPNAYYTAWYALMTLGQMKKGERVLIHTAAGGVGLAAVRIAQMVGAEIFATAGSKEKRDYLAKLGVRHVMDSRSLEWTKQIAEATQSKGVHLVLNSLAGEYITKGLESLCTHGRFLELGVRDIYANTPLPMAPFVKALSFHAVMVSEDVPEFRKIWDELMQKFYDRKLEPLPTKVFPVAEVDKAFEYMSRARHIGKVAVDCTDGGWPLG